MASIAKRYTPENKHDNVGKQPFEDISPSKNGVIFQAAMFVFSGVV